LRAKQKQNNKIAHGGENVPITPELVEELKILSLYNLGTTQEGIKIHKTASLNGTKLN
jgi:hypothetical protein